MLLAIDCGNTNTVFAVYDGDAKRGAWRISTDADRTPDEYAVWLTQLMTLGGLGVEDVDGAILATVVPDARFGLVGLVERYFSVAPLVVGDPSVKLGLDVIMDHPEQVGADRLVNAIGGYVAHGGDLIIVDFGTATSFDILDGDGNFNGSVLAPGVNLSVEALYMAAAQLPRITVARPEFVIGKATVPAMQSGIFWGYVDMISGLLARIVEAEGRPKKVIATGGLAALFAGEIKAVGAVEEDLTLNGLVELYRRNRSGS
ncbi:MAG: type III pantothenate kinase [Alphaproteobacteria bacterium]|nr:type III pantothenate kinase [Alphaproteobacteria bacterium]MCZ6763765.1 type III pantothenate kinase [Alphaproteobacteria bacterium]